MDFVISGNKHLPLPILTKIYERIGNKFVLKFYWQLFLLIFTSHGFEKIKVNLQDTITIVTAFTTITTIAIVIIILPQCDFLQHWLWIWLDFSPYSFQNVEYAHWIRLWRCGCLITWFCYQLIAKPGNETAAPPWPAPPWPDPYASQLLWEWRCPRCLCSYLCYTKGRQFFSFQLEITSHNLNQTADIYCVN